MTPPDECNAILLCFCPQYGMRYRKRLRFLGELWPRIEDSFFLIISPDFGVAFLMKEIEINELCRDTLIKRIKSSPPPPKKKKKKKPQKKKKKPTTKNTTKTKQNTKQHKKLPFPGTFNINLRNNPDGADLC